MEFQREVRGAPFQEEFLFAFPFVPSSLKSGKMGMKQKGKILHFPGAEKIKEPEEQRLAREWAEKDEKLKLLVEIVQRLYHEAKKENR